MSDLIDRRAAIDALERTKEKDPKGDIACFYNTIIDNKIAVIESLPSVQPEIIRCKDCKHKPHTSDKYNYDGFEIIFPDYRCPCRCEDEYYNRMPYDDWYCANAEMRGDDHETD